MADLVYLDSYTHKFLESATYIAAMLNDEIVRTSYVIMAALQFEDFLGSFYEATFGEEFSISNFLKNISFDEEKYSFIFENENAVDAIKNIGIGFTISQIRKFLENYDNENVSINDTAKENREKTYIKIFNPRLEYLDAMGQYSDDLKEAVVDATYRSVQAHRNYIDFPNLLYSIISLEESSAYNLLAALDIEPESILEMLENFYTILPEYDPDSNIFFIPNSVADFCEVLNDKYSSDQVCDILGRDDEIHTFWLTAMKKTKKNVIFTGKAGCGKTAIVEAITMSIVNETCPKAFIGYKVISMNITSMLAGTSYRGQFEEKAKMLVEFLEETPKIILFIDEIHQILGAGSTSTNSSFDLAGILKPLLARDDAVVIGATTENEYDMYIASDEAFKRRFKEIPVKEPKISELKPMIKKRIENLAKYHKVSISDELIDYMIIQAYCFDVDTANPDKTISLCDASMAAARLGRRRVLSKAHVNEVNINAINAFKKLPKEAKFSTACHEAGHYVLTKLLKTQSFKSTIVVSIVETDDYGGIHAYEIDESKKIDSDINYFKESMMCLMAGRAAEEYFTHSINAGARNDLAKVSDMVREMILNTGMDLNGDYYNLSLMGEYEDETAFISESTKDYVTKQTKKICDEIYEKTLKLIKENEERILRIAKALVIKGMLTKNELEKLFEGDINLIIESSKSLKKPVRKKVNKPKEKVN